MHGADIDKTFDRTGPALFNHIPRSFHVDTVELRCHGFTDTDDRRRMNDDHLSVFYVHEDVVQSLRLCNVSFIIGKLFIVPAGF